MLIPSEYPLVVAMYLYTESDCSFFGAFRLLRFMFLSIDGGRITSKPCTETEKEKGIGAGITHFCNIYASVGGATRHTVIMCVCLL